MNKIACGSEYYQQLASCVEGFLIHRTSNSTIGEFWHVDPKVITLIDSKLKGVSKDMTRDQLVEHCRVVIEKQRPSSTVNEVRVNGAMAGRQGNNMIVHECVMRMMLHAKQPLHQSDIGVLRDFAQTRNQCKNLRILSKTCNGPGKFVFP